MEKIPAHAKCAFHGVLFDVFQWDQEMFDGSIETFEAIRRVPSTEVILIDGDEVIIAEQEQPRRERFLSLFGGVMEDSEEPLAAAKRELLEESGYEAKDWELLAMTDFPWSKLEFNNYLYVARKPTLVATQQLDAGEKIQLKRVSFADFIDLARDNLRWSPPAEFRSMQARPKIGQWLKQKVFHVN